MKFHYFSVLLAGAWLFGISSTNAQTGFQARISPRNINVQSTTALRMPNLISLPGTSQTYQPDGAGGWIHMYNDTYTYDNLGRLTENIGVDPATGSTKHKATYAYDAQGNLIEDFTYWTSFLTPLEMSPNSMKYFYTYNAANYPTEIYSQQYNPTDSTFYNAVRLERTYTGTGQLYQETYYSWDDMAWQPFARYTNGYASSSSASPTEIVIEEYENGSYINSERISDLVWYQYSTPKSLFRDEWQPLSYNSHSWDGTAWQHTLRGNVTYDMYGGSVEVVEINGNGNWVNELRYTTTYDIHSNYTGYKEEFWNGAAWETDWQEEEVLTYNSNLDIVERLHRDGWNGGALHDDHKEVYGNFIYVSAAPANITELPISLYPVPAHNSLYISGDVTEHSEITFTDVSGRTVSAQELPAGSTKIDVSSLASGTYILHISNNSGSKIQKVVKL